MHSVIQSQSASFLFIPDALKTLIFEYLSYEDLVSIRLCDKSFFTLINNNNILWAQHLYKAFLDPSLRDQDLIEETSYFVDSSYAEKFMIFQKMEKCQLLLQYHCNIKQSLKTFVHHNLPKEEERFGRDIFKALIAPQTPFPCLKRDIHHFPTNTLFQNFLTEIYFGVHNTGQRSRNNLLVEEFIDRVKLSSVASVFSVRSIDILISNQSSFIRDNINDGTVENEAEKLFKSICVLINNYCQMVYSYLKAIQGKLLLLQEYTRLWKDFSLTIIDYNQILSPLLSYVNEEIKQKLPSDEYHQNLQTWSLMRQIWIDQVYTHLQNSLNISFCFVLNNQRLKQDSCNTDAIFLDDTGNEIYKLSDFETGSILQSYYHTIEDLSYDDQTIFFWSISLDSDAPQEILDSCILENTTKFYTMTQLNNADSIEMVFKNDIELFEKLFGNKLTSKLANLQPIFLNTSMLDTFGFEPFEVYNCSSSAFLNENAKQLSKSLPNVIEYSRLFDKLNNERQFRIQKNERKMAKLIKAGYQYIQKPSKKIIKIERQLKRYSSTKEAILV